MELITLTAKDDDMDEREEKIDAPGLFPDFDDESEESKLFSKERCYKFKKPVVFLTARVHPGEV